MSQLSVVKISHPVCFNCRDGSGNRLYTYAPFMGTQWTHDGQKKTRCLWFRLQWRCESGWEYPNQGGHINLCFQNQRRQSVKEGTAGTKDAREYKEVYRRAVRSGNAAECTRAKRAKQLQLSLVSALLTGAQISKGHETEEFVSTVNRCRCRKRIRKETGRHLTGRKVKVTFGKERYLPHYLMNCICLAK